MKRSYLAFVEDIPPYSGPKAARDSYADLKQLSAIPGHIYTRLELKILPGQRRFSKVPWLVPMLELLPPSSIDHLKEWGLSTVFVLAKNYNKLAHVDLHLRRFLVLLLGRLLFATRGDAVHCRFLPLLEDLGEVGGYAWGAAFLAHQFDGLSASERQTSTSGFYPFLQVWAYLHLPALGRGDLTRTALVPIARRWDSRRDTRHLADQLERLQEAIDSYPYLDVVWQPYLGRVMRDNLGYAPSGSNRVSWSSPSGTVFADRVGAFGDFMTRQIGVDVTGEIASLRALLHSAVQDREAAQRQTAELWRELERVRGAGAGGASSSRSAGGSPSLLEARLVGAVLRVEEAQRHLEERERDLELTTEHAMDLQGQRDQFRGERDQLRTRAEAAEVQVAEATRELAALRAQRPPGDQEEIIRLRAELLAQQTLARGLQQIVTDIGRSHSRSRSSASVSSSSRRRNEEEERRWQGEGSAQDGRGGGEMLPPLDR
ncbi:hypothetical protein Taro_046991 [Colocasia esculenta]|uniref:Aminotransferase-like plant mobile domain-containing protein n=1 Tax=Colocasia esculenta TaxID=4460 RepID=A0A843X4V6_COLES|nr:hypothetical protein [Colocasia esculenta]